MTLTVAASPAMLHYFEDLMKGVEQEYKIAEKARAKGVDASLQVEITLASTMAERVIGLISVVAPQLKGSGAVARITELEKQYGVLDWRVALVIAEEIAQERFCSFSSKQEAMEVGIRTGFAYGTVGVVSSPLEGFVNLEIKKRMDGQGEYFCLNFSGPIRNAGGTAASFCVIIADYVRKKFGYAAYDPTSLEIKRCPIELSDYHEYVTNLQYFPSEEESVFLMQHIPIEISGDPSENNEVSNYKDLPRIPTNRLRSGYCLIHSSCIALKAPKIWKELKKWGREMDMTHWDFLEDFLLVQKKAKMGKKAKEGKQDKQEKTEKVTPDFTFIKDLVAGRPVLSHPLRSGGFRLRYGRGRTSGYSGQSIHPATMHVLNNYIATGTQLKVERPGKAAAFTPCDRIEGPLVKLFDGSVLLLQSEQDAKQHKKSVAEILYLGDVLVNYGDFFNRAHMLVPAGYCEERWLLELEESFFKMQTTLKETLSTFKNKVNLLSSAELLARGIAEFLEGNANAVDRAAGADTVMSWFSHPMKNIPSFEQAALVSRQFSIPLHPRYTYHWKSISVEQFRALVNWLSEAGLFKNLVRRDNGSVEKIVLHLHPPHPGKRTLELLGVPHVCVGKEYAIIEEDHARALLCTLALQDERSFDNIFSAIETYKDQFVLDIINVLSPLKIMDKDGIFIGARMGRPEKAKMRKLTGSPHTLFPVGDEGGKMRSFQSTLDAKKITANFPLYTCPRCKANLVLQTCMACQVPAVKEKYCKTCGRIPLDKVCGHQPEPALFTKQSIDSAKLFSETVKLLNIKIYPDLIKGVRGTSNKEHIPEHLAKGILRAKHNLAVNKDGTVRYDASEIAITHFKPKEIGVSVETLLDLKYTHDIFAEPLISDEQILELKMQDILLPCCPDSPDEPADQVLFRASKFVDELLESFYHLDSFYNLKTPQELVGKYIIGLAPHTSAGILGRIIGFSKTQGFLAHPCFHAAMRRDVDGDESCILLLLDAFLNFSKINLPQSRGSTMDAPLVLTTVLNPAEVDDMAFHVDTVWRYPLELYRAADEYKMPWDVKIHQLGLDLNTPAQYEGMGFTHDSDNLNAGVLCSQYKILPSMEEKLEGQMDLAKKIRAVDETDVARLIIEKHFIRDIKGNLRKFSTQEFRCVNCNEKFRRPPLIGKCTACGGKLLFTISEGSIVKYLEPTIKLAAAFSVSTYLKQTIQLTKERIEGYFGKNAERQEGLAKWA